jgi:hypothetical protein
MRRVQLQLVKLAFFVIVMPEVSSPVPPARPSLALVRIAESTWGRPSPAPQPSAWASNPDPQEKGSAIGTLATHTAVGAGAGLLIGLLLSGTSRTDDNPSIVVTWTALGAAAGVVSGGIRWLMDSPDGRR